MTGRPDDRPPRPDLDGEATAFAATGIETAPVFLPCLTGIRTPLNRPDMTGRITGLHPGVTPAMLAYATNGRRGLPVRPIASRRNRRSGSARTLYRCRRRHAKPRFGCGCWPRRWAGPSA